MLDEAIEYLKSLQLQVQVDSSFLGKLILHLFIDLLKCTHVLEMSSLYL